MQGRGGAKTSSHDEETVETKVSASKGPCAVRSRRRPLRGDSALATRDLPPTYSAAMCISFVTPVRFKIWTIESSKRLEHVSRGFFQNTLDRTLEYSSTQSTTALKNTQRRTATIASFVVGRRLWGDLAPCHAGLTESSLSSKRRVVAVGALAPPVAAVSTDVVVSVAGADAVAVAEPRGGPPRRSAE